jgi:hypothetical protein
MMKALLMVLGLGLLSGCWFHAGNHGVGGGVGKLDAPAPRNG